MSTQASCWTCRLRRKKCDRYRPICKACADLDITCYFSHCRPDWMEGGQGQKEMANRIKAEVKQSAEARRERQYVQVISISGGRDAPYRPGSSDSAVTAVKSNSSGHLNDSNPDLDPGHSESAPESVEIREDWVVGSGSGPQVRLAGVSDAWSIFRVIVPSTDLSDMEFDLTMTYLDYVFPFLFPFYQPPMLDGGRAWLIALLRDNKALFHIAMSLSSYFLTLILANAAPGRHDICKIHVWEKLAGHMDTGIKSMQEEMGALNQQGTRATLLRRARVMESIIQLMVFEVAMAKTPEWDVHLTAAITLFKEIFEECGLTEGRPDLRKVIIAMDKLSWTAGISERRVWNTDQATFRFFVAVLLYADIISSVSLKRRPRLQEYHAHLISTGNAVEDPEFQLQMEYFIGCQGWVLLAISEITALDTWKKEAMVAGTLTPAELAVRSEPICQSLRTGLARLDMADPMPRTTNLQDILRTYYRHGSPFRVGEQTVVTRIWAHAAQIYLMVVVLGWQPHNSPIRGSVAAVFHLLQTVSSPAALHSLVWPFFVAGCLAEAAQKEEFREIASASGALQAFGSVGEALRIMEQVWQMRDLGMEWDFNACFELLGSRVLLI